MCHIDQVHDILRLEHGGGLVNCVVVGVCFLSKEFLDEFALSNAELSTQLSSAPTQGASQIVAMKQEMQQLIEKAELSDANAQEEVCVCTCVHVYMLAYTHIYCTLVCTNACVYMCDID